MFKELNNLRTDRKKMYTFKLFNPQITDTDNSFNKEINFLLKITTAIKKIILK